MLTLFLRKETHEGAPVVAYYADALMTERKAINPWPSRATALTQGDKIKPENLAGMRAKAQVMGHTEGECLCVEKDPMHYIRTGRFAA